MVIIETYRRAPEDQATNSLSGNMYILEATQNGYFLISQNNPGAARVFDCEFRFPVLMIFLVEK